MNNRFSFDWANFIMGIVGVFVFIGIIGISVFLGAKTGYEQAEMKFKKEALEKICSPTAPEQVIK